MGLKDDLTLKSSPIFTYDESISGAICMVSLTFECTKGYTVRYADLVVYRNKQRVYKLEQVLIDDDHTHTFPLGNFVPGDSILIKAWVRTLHTNKFKIKAIVTQTNPQNEQVDGPKDISSAKDWESDIKYTVIGTKPDELLADDTKL